MSRSTISFWIEFIISMMKEEECRLVRVKAHEVRKIATSLLRGRDCAVQQVLKAGN